MSFQLLVPVSHRYRYGLDRFPDHFREMEKFMENLFPELSTASSPFDSEYSRPRRCRHQYVEYMECDDDDEKESTKEKTKPTGGNVQAKESLKGAIEEDDRKFKVSFGMKQFKPEEIKVRLSQGQLTVEGVQEVKNDDGRFSRRFIRQYALPKNVDVQSFKSRFSKDGVLKIEAAKLPTEPGEKCIDIETEMEEESGPGSSKN